MKGYVSDFSRANENIEYIIKRRPTNKGVFCWKLLIQINSSVFELRPSIEGTYSFIKCFNIRNNKLAINCP